MANVPWVAAVLLAPLWFGAVSSEAQIALAAAISVSLLFMAGKTQVLPASRIGKLAAGGLVMLALLTLIPLPLSLAKTMNPLAAQWADRLALPSTALSLSPGGTLLRLWQFGMILAVFALAREGATVPRFTGLLSYGAAAAMLLLAGTEFWRLMDGKGVWDEVRHYPAGTFANRNHFANWMALGSMFVFGALIRKVRHIREEHLSGRHQIAAALLAAGLLAGIASIVACGSRGGMLALAAGFAVWIWVLKRNRTGAAGLLVLGLSLAGGVVAFGAAGELFMRRITQDAVGFKWQIWMDALALWTKAPLTGVGLGAFEPVFNAHKSFHGEGTFLHAENEYVQWLVESGVAGTACAIALLAAAVRFMTKPNDPRRFAKSEFYYGALAALAAFAVHAFFEFVTQVMSLALFAALLGGLMAGLKERASGPAVKRAPQRINFAAALLLGGAIAGLAGLQAAAAWKWRTGGKVMTVGLPEKARREAFSLWPLDSGRAVVLARQLMRAAESGQIESSRANALALGEIDAALAWQPLNWELRLERAWLRLAAAPESALPDALTAMELNPLQTKTPLRFAASFASLHPPSALEVLRRARYEKASEVREALRLAWSIDPRPELLWEIAPEHPVGMRALAEFAREQKLPNLAREADARALAHAHAP